ncbi:hypothetical protein GGR54DRAFT_621760 [Hypoxylon sp. NC1633]|nr:hypothetical protein GGR54DRAFT_621760 [Hypoxylon sp. NC1633]
MVPQVASGPRSLESLPARPPTPPREKRPGLDSSYQNILSSHPVDTRLNLHTPPNYSPETAETGSRRSTKKVGFLAEAQYRDAPTYANKENVKSRPTPASAPSSTASTRPIKSILKQTSSPGRLNPLDPSDIGDDIIGQVNITAMLDSTIQQLAGTDRDSKIDAYMTLSRALKASNNLPDRIALQDKMSLFTQFIQRDMTAKNLNGNTDSSLVNHALALLCTFFHFPAIASTLSSDFGIFVIEHSIRSFDDPSIAKEMARHLMQAVASQEFSARVMTADRVGRLVASLHRIEEHLKGKSIIMSRILIYRKLVKQSKPYMAMHSDWLLDLFTDMLSSMKEIRAGAVALGLEASFNIGKEKQLSRRAMEILQLQVDETKYIEYYVQRLMAMTEKKTESASVPQVWSVVILLLRCPVDKWEFFGPWLEIIQRCFNTGDYHTKLEANFAWNRLVYTLHLNETSFSKTIGTVCQPFISQLKRKGSGKQLDELRRVVVGSVCNLFYYTFKPNLSTVQVDTYWDVCVRPLIQRLASSEADGKRSQTQTQSQSQKLTAAASENVSHAILILTGLFDSSTPRLWKEDRVAENTLVRPDELPALDPKWVRRNAARVFAVVEPILQRTFPDLANSNSGSYTLWHTLISAVSAAASKEVMVSADTTTFVAHAFSVLIRIWSRGLGESDISSDSQQGFLDATQAYVSMMVKSLGSLPFTEKLLSLNKPNSFVPIATPSRRLGKEQGLVRSPLHHLFSILSTLPPGIQDDEGIAHLIKAVLNPLILSRPSAHAKMDPAREFAQILPTDALFPYGPWVFVSDIFSLSLENSQSSSLTNTSGIDPTKIGQEYREIVKHLERGIKSAPNLPWEHWQSLFQLLVASVTDEAGEAGCSIAVVEPLAKSLLERLSLSLSRHEVVPHNVFKSGMELIATARQPRDRHALDAARRRLWGTSIAGSRSASFDPFDSFYRLASYLLETSYMHFDNYDHDEFPVPLLTEVASFFVRCNRSLVFNALGRLQRGIGLWIRDENARYSSKQSSNVSEAVKVLWDRICSLFADTDSLENFQLDAVEELLCSAFQSKHRHIVNAVSAMWNRAFEQADEIHYPEKLKEVLISIHYYVDVVLPGLDISSHESSGPEPAFIESQDDLDIPIIETNIRDTPEMALPRRSASPESVHLSLPAKRGRDITPVSSRSRSARQSATPRVRHDDSQIQFAPIEPSSPGHDVIESQLLTDRQKEVRERQRENTALYSDIRASAEKRKSPRSASRDLEQAQHSEQPRAATPETNHGIDDFVSSTPTPRRGHAPTIDYDHEMTDEIPSSPPEPRRNLLAEMEPGSRRSSMFQEFPVSSSPIFGSPVPKLRTTKTNEIIAEQEDREHVQDDTMAAMDDDGPDKVAEYVQESALVDAEKSGNDNAPEEPSTPRQTRSMGKVPESSPKSNSEDYVDALTSPAVRTPRALRRSNALKRAPPVVPIPEAKDRSFELSYDEERSFARLVNELDPGKCKLLFEHDTSSPEKQRKEDGATLECIMVKTGSKRSRSKSMERSDIESSPVVPSSPVVEAESLQSSKPPSKRWRRKRKRERHAEKSHEPGSSHKKQMHRRHADIEATPDAQPDTQPDTPVSRDTTGEAAEIDTMMEEEIRLDMEMKMLYIPSQDSASQDLAAAEPVQGVSSPTGADDTSADRESDTEAVNLQIITEASQQSESGLVMPVMLKEEVALIDADTKMTDQEDGVEEKAEETAEIVTEEVHRVEEAAAEVEMSAVERIMGALKNGLDGLRTATLSRDEVNRIEDMFFDIKKELYQAESRNRHA